MGATELCLPAAVGEDMGGQRLGGHLMSPNTAKEDCFCAKVSMSPESNFNGLRTWVA